VAASTRSTPPCSRCGNLELEQRDVADLDDPLEDIGTGWRDVIEAKYVAGYVAVGVLLLVLGLGFVGVIDLPGMGEPTIPTPRQRRYGREPLAGRGGGRVRRGSQRTPGCSRGVVAADR